MILIFINPAVMTVTEYFPPQATELRRRYAAARNHLERRYLTIMFCDLVNSTRLAVRLDPEDLMHLFQSYRRLCEAITSKHEGLIADYAGDGIMVVFGYPRTREDDAARAVRAALDLTSALDAHKSGSADSAWNRISIRIGIASGLVLLGDPEGTVVGETPNLAARLQAAAQPGAIIISNETRSLVKHIFRLKNIGLYTLRGYEQMLRLWQVISRAQRRNAVVRINPAVLTARLYRLPVPARRVAQVAALLGRAFSYSLITTLWPYQREQLEQGLRLLCRSEVLVKTGVGGNTRYRFKWALMQEVAQQSTLKQVRLSLHRQATPIFTGETT